MEGLKDRKERPSRRQRWFGGKKILLAVVAVVVVGTIGIGLAQYLQVHRLHQAAATLRLGDSRAKVFAALGQPSTTYTTGFPAGGGAPTIWGEAYGGILNKARARIDASVYGLLYPGAYDSGGGLSQVQRGLLSGYELFLAQGTSGWPVAVEFGKGGTVIGVRR